MTRMEKSIHHVSTGVEHWDLKDEGVMGEEAQRAEEGLWEKFRNRKDVWKTPLYKQT